MHNPTQADWTEVKRVLQYLKGTCGVMLKLGESIRSQSDVLTGYVDADWAGDHTDRKSNTGYVFKLHGGTISWSSRKQPCVALSSTEAEYITVSEACREALWLKWLLVDLHVKENSVPVIYEDNQSCLTLLESEKVNQRSKHIDTKFHFSRDLIANQFVKFVYCPSEADLLTKPLEAVKTRKFSSLIGLVNLINYLLH